VDRRTQVADRRNRVVDRRNQAEGRRNQVAEEVGPPANPEEEHCQMEASGGLHDEVDLMTDLRVEAAD